LCASALVFATATAAAPWPEKPVRIAPAIKAADLKP
jgi:hypothetical protein